mmetsp:Transcript_20789/g.20146  ORF Transcript_20789/g.20146 Transcript_20789/m.20146 type:complete len:575 (+) Transcript_20789:89-1813(+)|eukprot:CAMPEP_0119042906 /NCGR_PEP_ID=MMETSP1177-20130426/16263_1 /TAXON_ID=2985 /ORGANISM="Ochromonas sp, Strain CCMP1899" /LENGTH=574 /DNA_ID=CAMNT_0007010011 /DNA_START=89 /DNA_END=1813 /DNA_ORIENTATION=-
MAEVSNQFYTDGTNYGKVDLHDKNILRMESLTSNQQMIDLTLDNVALCVVPVSNTSEMEIHFHEIDEGTKAKEDNLVQITLHFPPGDVPEEDDPEIDDYVTPAEEMRQKMMDTGVIKSTTGDNIIAEFSKEQGNFVTPRGKYAIQMTSSFMHMQGAQYSYKIKYTDIGSLYLLPKLEGGREAFVIALEKPIRQGKQIYQHLVLETHKIEHTMNINLSEEEIKSKYDGQLTTEMTMPTSHLIAKIFKILSQTPVFVSKGFVSTRTASAVKCSLKANEGALYPLAKSFVFIHKPTIILKFEDVECIEFKRYETTGATNLMRNFDLTVTMKSGGPKGGTIEHSFNLIDRAEYKPLFDFLESKKLEIRNPPAEEEAGGGKRGAIEAAFLGEEGGDDEDSEDDDDYEGGKSDAESSGDDSKGSSDEDNEEEAPVKSEKKRKAPEKESRSSSSSSSSKVKKEKEEKPDKGSKKKAKKVKDKNAPKGASSSFLFFSSDKRKDIKEAHPEWGVADIAREAGGMWRGLSAEDRLPYEERGKSDKERAIREMKEYNAAKAGAVKQEDDGDDDDNEEDVDADEED